MELLSHLFDLLFQGTAAGLIVLFFTWLFNKKAQKEKTKKYALLMYLEIQGHVALLKQLLSTDNGAYLTTPESVKLNCTYGDLAIPNLTSLPIDDLKRIGSYYQAILGLDHLFQKSNQKKLRHKDTTMLSQSIVMGEIICALLCSYWDAKNAGIHRQNYVSLQKEAQQTNTHL